MPKNEKRWSQENKGAEQTAIPVKPLVLFMWGVKQIILSVYTAGKNKKKKKNPSFQHMETSRGWEEDVLVNVVVSE